jgi:DNA-binding MarR family transcriptional regulator
MRPSERTQPALAAMQRALGEIVRGQAPDLTSRQLALLLTVFMAHGPHTVRALAEALKLPKPAVVRALDRLEELKFVKRLRDPNDRRSVEVVRRARGAVFLSDLAETVLAATGSARPA